MYRCSEVVRLISTDEFASAGFFKKLGIRLHLMMCRHCARYFRQLRALGAALRDSVGPVPSSEVEAARRQVLENLAGKK